MWWNPLLKRYFFFIGVSPCVNCWQSIYKSRFWAWVKPPIAKTFDFLHSHLFLAYTLIPFLLRYSFALTPLQTRCKSVSWNGRKMGFASNLVGSCMGGTTILYFQCKDTEIFFWTRKTRNKRNFLINHRSHRLEGFFRLRSWLRSLRSRKFVVN